MRLPIPDPAAQSYILIADPNPDAQHALRHLLSGMGLATQTAATGEEAIACIRQARPALILLDPQMPQINGYDVRSYLRATPHISSIPVLLVTSIPDEAIANLDLSGAIGLFRKAGAALTM